MTIPGRGRPQAGSAARFPQVARATCLRSGALAYRIATRTGDPETVVKALPVINRCRFLLDEPLPRR
jgi:hypothetical protein